MLDWSAACSLRLYDEKATKIEKFPHRSQGGQEPSARSASLGAVAALEQEASLPLPASWTSRLQS